LNLVTWLTYKTSDQVLKLLVDHALDVNRKHAGTTLLGHALDTHHENRIQLLLTSANIELNDLDDEGNTLLIRSIKGDYPCALKMLLDHPSIDINKKNSEGLTALDYALEISHFESFKIMGNHPKMGCQISKALNCQGDTLLHTAAANQNIEQIQMLLALTDLDANAKNYEGYTAYELTSEPAIKILLGETMKNQQRIRKK
jgi:ankyrin repeat protein